MVSGFSRNGLNPKAVNLQKAGLRPAEVIIVHARKSVFPSIFGHFAAASGAIDLHLPSIMKACNWDQTLSNETDPKPGLLDLFNESQHTLEDTISSLIEEDLAVCGLEKAAELARAMLAATSKFWRMVCLCMTNAFRTLKDSSRFEPKES